jgi:hypothetical protein
LIIKIGKREKFYEELWLGNLIGKTRSTANENHDEILNLVDKKTKERLVLYKRLSNHWIFLHDFINKKLESGIVSPTMALCRLRC